MTNDQELRIKWSRIWSSHGFISTPDEINCDGCHSSSELLGHCKTCAVRLCGIEKKYITCAECNGYPCNKLTKLWNDLKAPEAKERLDQLLQKSL